MIENIESFVKGYYFFCLQMQVPPDGNLQGLIIELCVKEVYYPVVDGVPDYTVIKGDVPGSVQIIPITNPTQLESLYPGLIQSMTFLQQVAINEGLKFIENLKQQKIEDEAREKIN